MVNYSESLDYQHLDKLPEQAAKADSDVGMDELLEYNIIKETWNNRFRARSAEYYMSAAELMKEYEWIMACVELFEIFPHLQKALLRVIERARSRERSRERGEERDDKSKGRGYQRTLRRKDRMISMLNHVAKINLTMKRAMQQRIININPQMNLNRAAKLSGSGPNIGLRQSGRFGSPGAGAAGLSMMTQRQVASNSAISEKNQPGGGLAPNSMPSMASLAGASAIASAALHLQSGKDSLTKIFNKIGQAIKTAIAIINDQIQTRETQTSSSQQQSFGSANNASVMIRLNVEASQTANGFMVLRMQQKSETTITTYGKNSGPGAISFGELSSAFGKNNSNIRNN